LNSYTKGKGIMYFTLNTTLDERALSCCRESQDAEERGDYAGALLALNPFMERIGEEPKSEGLNDFSRASLLLRAGVLTSRIGTHKGIRRAQEKAKNLLSLSRALFEQTGDGNGVGAAQTYLGVCYYLLGESDEARILLRDALAHFSEPAGEHAVKANIWLAIVEYGARRYGDALRIHRQTQNMLAGAANHYLLGTFHNEHARALEAVGRTAGDLAYIDRALIEFEAASFHLEQAGHERFQARVENNRGLLFLELRKYKDALTRFDAARVIFKRLKDASVVARIDVNRANAYLGAGNLLAALRVIKSALAVLEQGDEAASLSEAFTVHGTILARARNAVQARAAFERAVTVGREAGNREAAGVAYLTMLEELDLSDAEVASSYQEALTLLSDIQDGSVGRRLLNLSGRILAQMGKRVVVAGGQADEWEGFSLYAAKAEFEKGWVIKAMAAAGGNVAQASRLLGFEKPQRLYQLIREHGLDELQNKRRRRSIIKPESNVSDMHNYVEFILPEGVTQADVCVMHKITSDVLLLRGARPGDYALVRVGEVAEAELVGVDVYGESYRIGLLRVEEDRVGLLSNEGEELLAPAPRSTLKVEGKVVGYLKAEDVAAYRKGEPVKSYSV
jgi:tetratricopeptide (TPR) repeat protein